MYAPPGSILAPSLHIYFMTVCIHVLKLSICIEQLMFVFEGGAL